MSILGLYGFVPKAKYKSYNIDMDGAVYNMLLEKQVDEVKHTTKYIRQFSTDFPNQIWGTDVTEFHIASGKLYLSPILDFHTREIISYSVSKSPNYKQIKDMLNDAFKKHTDLNNLIFHSDRGWQYQMKDYRTQLKSKNIIQSMSRKGNCYDNSPTENFFGIMKKEMFIGKQYSFKTLDELESEIHNYIDYYNNKRISLKLKGLTPLQFRSQSNTV